MLRSFHYDRLLETARYPVSVANNISPGTILFFMSFVMVIAFGAILLMAGVVFYFTVGDFSSDTGFGIWIALIVVCASFIIVCFVGMRGSHLVSLDILINFFWGVIVLIVPVSITIYGSYNYLDNSLLYAQHQWVDDSYDNLRESFCIPKDTFTTLCAVPFNAQFNFPPGNETTYSSTQWCKDVHNSMDCEKIRDDALNRALKYLNNIATINAALAGLALVLSFFSLFVCFQILTSRVLSQTMNDNINFLLIIPMAGCVALTISYWWLTRLSDTFLYFYVVYIYLALAGAQATALTYGIFAGRSKSRVLLRLYLFFLAIIIGGFMAGGSVSLNIVVELDPSNPYSNWDPSRETISEIACTKGLVGCTNCDAPPLESPSHEFNSTHNYTSSLYSMPDRCPEWDTKDVRQLLSVESRLVAVVCFLFSLYHIGAFIVTYVVQDNLKNYKSDFV